ncbi:hypothetical protein JZL89_02770 [Providencia rettgeri]|uniref:hypothetical protein n=1 Tax=Providencia rettgeri TaxID=587 RepID=UPI0019D0A7D1|nr:hypothetical protein [Providencia rettgeri]MBN6364284.1 hypothetical protein [Providencia rettgeri]
MKGTTLTELIQRYDWQAIALADRQAPLGSSKERLFHALRRHYRKKLYPRGKVIARLVKIQHGFIEYQKSEEYIQKKCDEYAAKYPLEASNAGN